jgi:hypothetical protein
MVKLPSPVEDEDVGDKSYMELGTPYFGGVMSMSTDAVPFQEVMALGTRFDM